MLNLTQKKIELVYSMSYFVYDLVSNNETLLKYFTMFLHPQSSFGNRSPSFYLALESLFCSYQLSVDWPKEYMWPKMIYFS